MNKANIFIFIFKIGLAWDGDKNAHRVFTTGWAYMLTLSTYV